MACVACDDRAISPMWEWSTSRLLDSSLATLSSDSSYMPPFSYVASPAHVASPMFLSESSQLEGLEGYPSYEYTGIAQLRERVSQQYAKLLDGSSYQQFLIFRNVPKTERDGEIEKARERDAVLRHTRMTYFPNTELLIIKVVTGKHERGHLRLDIELTGKARDMGLKREFDSLGATRQGRPNAPPGQDSDGEGDSSYKPLSRRRREADWPTLVIEAGLSQGLPALRTKAQWWFAQSGGDVKIVLLISLKFNPTRKIVLEKWRMVQQQIQGPITRSRSALGNQALPWVPQCVHTITITPNPANPPNFATLPDTVTPPNPANYRVVGAPLRLEFVDIFLRQPNPPESDMVFDQTELIEYAADYWMGLQ